MRILVMGQSGTEKPTFAQNIVQHYLDKKNIIDTAEATEEISWYQLEDRKWFGNISFLGFLTSYNFTKKREIWSTVFDKILDEINTVRSRHTLLFIHGTYYREGYFSAPANWDLLLKFNPDIILTLIDDIYDIWQRVKERTDPETSLSLMEILNWRNTEILFSHTLSNELKIDNTKFSYDPPKKISHLFGGTIPHFVMSVKHSPETFYRLLFERHRRNIVYASFPITRTRRCQSRRDDINNFRRKLRETGAIVIDPLMIDELRIDQEDKETWYGLRHLTSFQEYQSDRWLIQSPSVPPPSTYSRSPFEELSDKQIDDVIRDISNQIKERDFRMIRQSDRLIAYRPFYPQYNIDDFESIFGKSTDTPSNGVLSEIEFALELAHDVWAFHPRCDYTNTQRDNFFRDSLTWNRVKMIPSRNEITTLLENDFSGFSSLFNELKNVAIDKS